MSGIVIRLLPDGSDRVRIHWFRRTDGGPIRTPGRTLPTAIGPLRLGYAQGQIACQPERQNVGPDVRNGQLWPLIHSDDPRAVTCDLCQATPEYKKIMADLGEALEVKQ